MGFSRQGYWNGLPFPFPGDLPDPGIKPGSPALQADSLLSEPPGKPKSTGVGSLSLLHGIVPTQGSNPGLPYCRQILYSLSHQGSPKENHYSLCASRFHSRKNQVSQGFSVQGDSPGKNTGLGCHALFQGIFPTQGLNPGLPHGRWILYQLSHQGSPRILEWVACPFSRGSS